MLYNYWDISASVLAFHAFLHFPVQYFVPVSFHFITHNLMSDLISFIFFVYIVYILICFLPTSGEISSQQFL